jgi:asparagine synthase (glutamine-hydrolysing)
MSFLGIASAAGRAKNGSVEVLPLRCEGILGRHSFALWSRIAPVISGGLGILMCGRLFRATDLVSKLGVEAADDASLLLHAYSKWGIEFPRHLYGEYAFALWDGPAGRLLLGRDPLGCWPLYYAQRDSGLLFASEIRRILAQPGIATRPNEQRIAGWLGLFLEPTDQTFFEGVFSVQPGSTLIFEDGRVTRNRFWQPENTPVLRLRDSREYAEGLLEVLDSAVLDRLTPQAVIASQLSGGLDSSSVTATAARLLQRQGRRLLAFTSVPRYKTASTPGHFSDEGPHAAAVAAMYPNIDHILVHNGAHPVFSLFDLFGSAQEEPPFNPQNYDWHYEMCLQARRRGAQTCLNAGSGNFTFSYNGNRALRSLAMDGRWLALARLMWQTHRNTSRRWRGMAYELLRPSLPTWARLSLDRPRGRVLSLSDYLMIRPEFARRYDLSLTALEEKQIHLDDISQRLLFLCRADRGPSYSAYRKLTGVSMTDPAGDRRVIEYCLSLPIECFCENGVPRSLIRNAMIGRLPEQVRTERRKGLQAADFRMHFETEKPEARAEIARLKKTDLAARALDLPAMEAQLQWPAERIAETGESLYWCRILRALSVGRFLRQLEDGVLFTLPEELAAHGGSEPEPTAAPAAATRI